MMDLQSIMAAAEKQIRDLQTSASAKGTVEMQATEITFPLLLLNLLSGSLTETQRTRPASSTPAALQAALASIPTASDGDVVYAQHHNSLKHALLTMASFLGDQVLSQTVTLSFAPSLLRAGAAGGHDWTIVEGEAQQGSQAAVQGWVPVDLPDGLRIQSLAVHGTATAGKNVGTISVKLKRRPLQSTAAPDDVVGVTLTGTSPSFGQPASVTQTDKRVVDRFAYQYYVGATVAGAATDAGIRLFGFEVTCTRW
jgi:hypothetical protein